MSARPTDPPSLGVVVTGGIGVLVVIAFVAAIALGRSSRVEPGDRVGIAGRDGSVTILAGRCPDERVMAVEVRRPGADPLWRIESERGTIDREFVVGAEPPALFRTVVPFEGPLPDGPLEAEVTVDHMIDARAFEVVDLEEAGVVGIACDDRSLGVLPVIFILGAAGVVAAYGAMVMRFVRAR